MTDSDILRGKEPWSLGITPSLSMFIITAVAAIVGFGMWLKTIDVTSKQNTDDIRDRTARIVELEHKVQRLEWQLQLPQRTQP